MRFRPDLFDMAAITAFVAGDTVLLILGLHWPIALGCHLFLVLMLGLIGAETTRPMLQIAAVLGLGGGPIGGAIAAMLAIGLRVARPDPERNAAWYRQLSGIEYDAPRRSLARDLLAGRLGAYRPPAHHDLATIFTQGTRDEKQAALRWLSQRDLMKFEAAIRLALENDDNTIRIEAAALMGRLQNPILARAESPENAILVDSTGRETDAGRNSCV